MMQTDVMIPVNLTAEKWNTVLTQLSEGPFRIVAPLITEIRDQALAYQQKNIGNSPDTAGLSQHVPH